MSSSTGSRHSGNKINASTSNPPSSSTLKRLFELLTDLQEGRPRKVQKIDDNDSLDEFSQMMFYSMGKRVLGLLESGEVDEVTRFFELWEEGKLAGTLNVKMVRELLLRRRPFSSAMYPNKARFFRLPSKELYDGWHPLEIKPVLLPGRIQKQLSRSILSANEDVNFNIELHQSIVGLWDGLFQDQVEETMTITSFSPGVPVEEELLVFVTTTVGEDEDDKEITADSVAQVMCQMHSAAEINRFLGFSTIRVHACLKDAQTIIFMEYDPVKHKFSKTEPLVLQPAASPLEVARHFVKVANTQFSILLESYLEIVKLCSQHPRYQIDTDDVDPDSSDNWPWTVTEAYHALATAQRAAEVNNNFRAGQALKYLKKSVERFPFAHDHYQEPKLGKAVLGNDIESAIDDALALEGYTTSNTRDKGWTLPDTTYLQQGFTEICKVVVWMKSDEQSEIIEVPWNGVRLSIQLLDALCKQVGWDEKKPLQWYDFGQKIWNRLRMSATPIMVANHGYMVFIKAKDIDSPEEWQTWLDAIGVRR